MTKRKRYMLLPAISRHLKKCSQNGSLLDVGCGNGDLYDIAVEKGYRYYGLDISPDMIARAEEDHPYGEYLVISATQFSKYYTLKFDIIIISMLFPTMNDRRYIFETLSQSKNILNNNGQIIVSVTHPCYDHYMLKWIFDRKDIRTSFTGYYSSGTKFSTPQKFNGRVLTLNDYHWTITDYIKCILDNGLMIKNIDECPPPAYLKKTDKNFYSQLINHPVYLLLTMEKE